MRCKCSRCERACHAQDKTTKFGIPCCTDCAKEILSLEGEVIRRTLLSYGIYLEYHTEVGGDISMIARSTALHLSVEYSAGEVMVISDENREGNFATTYPKLGNTRSITRCVNMSIGKICRGIK